MINNKGTYTDEYIMLEEKYGIESTVFSKSFITDSRVNEVYGLYQVELPSASAVKGDAILDMIVLNSTNKINGDIVESKKSLNKIRIKYCDNERLADLMKKLDFYELIDVGNNIQCLNDQTAATCFEALIYNIYAHYDLNKAVSFLDEINFYIFDENKVEIVSDEELKLYLHRQIESIETINGVEKEFVHSKQYRDMIDIFEKTINRITLYHGYGENNFEATLNYLSSKYSIYKLDNKKQKKFLSKFTHLVKRIDNLIVDVEQINHEKMRILLNNNEIFIKQDYFKSYKERYIVGFLNEIYKSL